MVLLSVFFFFFFQAEDGIRVLTVTGVQTCALPIFKFYASLRLDIRRIGPVKEKEDVIGSHVRVKVVKNKVGPPFKQAEFDIMYAQGISHASLVLDIAAESGIIEKSGAWDSHKTPKIGHGRENSTL